MLSQVDWYIQRSSPHLVWKPRVVYRLKKTRPQVNWQGENWLFVGGVLKINLPPATCHRGVKTIGYKCAEDTSIIGLLSRAAKSQAELQGFSYSQKYRVKRGFPITLSLQFPDLGQPKKSYIIYSQLNMFSQLIMDQYSHCINHRSESGNTIFSIFL